MSDPLERVIRPIVEGQLRGFVKEHPGVLNGVTWYKGNKHGQVATFVNSVAKRVVRDLLCAENRKRIEDALFEIWETRNPPWQLVLRQIATGISMTALTRTEQFFISVCLAVFLSGAIKLVAVLA